MLISGQFTVTLTALPSELGQHPQASFARMRIDKQFTGPLAAHSVGEMLSVRTHPPCAGYVALERVTGTLDGKQGSFVLQHYGIIDGAKPMLLLNVVPGSGTEQLLGLSGSMHIDIQQGVHYYELDYQLPEQ